MFTSTSSFCGKLVQYGAVNLRISGQIRGFWGNERFAEPSPCARSAELHAACIRSNRLLIQKLASKATAEVSASVNGGGGLNRLGDPKQRFENLKIGAAEKKYGVCVRRVS
jgi:hypothetical protein